MEAPPQQITQLLQAWRAGDQGALDHLVSLIYEDLHRLARQYMARERPNHTLQATALVHEVYLRLFESAQPSWQDRAHFLAVCARTMRRILVDSIRHHQAVKRGGEAAPLCLQEAIAVAERPDADLLAVDDALAELAELDPRKGQLVELRFFGGLTVKEAAEVLKISEPTAFREWHAAKAWLRLELTRNRTGEEQSDGA